MSLPTALIVDYETLQTHCTWFATENKKILHNNAGSNQLEFVNIFDSKISQPDISGFLNTIRSRTKTENVLMLVQMPDADITSLATATNDQYEINFAVWFLKRSASLAEQSIAMQTAWECWTDFNAVLKHVFKLEQNKAYGKIVSDKCNCEPITKLPNGYDGYLANYTLQITNQACINPSNFNNI